MLRTSRIESHGRSYTISYDVDSRVGGVLNEGRPYEHHLLEHIYESRFRGVAVDVGAHIGNHSLWFAAICGLSVVSFEPIYYEQLEINIRHNPKLHIVSSRFALGSTYGVAKIVGRGRLKPAAGGTVKVRRLDYIRAKNPTLFKPRVCLIKIDVEDMEPAVLKGARTLIRQDRPTIFAEARDEQSHKRIAEVLESMGYSLTLIAKTSTPVERWDP